MNNAAIAAALFEALALQDDRKVRALCSPGLQVRQNGGAPMSLESLLKFNALVHRAVSGFRYEDAVRAATVTGFVEEHAVRGTTRSGCSLELAVCVVAEVSEGKVTLVREYFDSAAAAPLTAALAPK